MDPHRHDTARTDAWLRVTLKLQELALRPFLADLFVVATEGLIDRLLDEE
jgi:hypothetical protein